ncbi:MAG TPA: response regulator [Pyrinomonadaceae bacterium]|jgi:CheY-like chemotaxis protein
MDNPDQWPVLVVEDVSEIAEQIEAVLLRRGHRAVMAANATEAMKIAEADRPGLIITDLDLPTFNSLIDSIRLHKTLNDLVVAIIDINGPEVDGRSDVTVLNDFNQLDQLLTSTIRH